VLVALQVLRDFSFVIWMLLGRGLLDLCFWFGVSDLLFNSAVCGWGGCICFSRIVGGA